MTNLRAAVETLGTMGGLLFLGRWAKAEATSAYYRWRLTARLSGSLPLPDRRPMQGPPPPPPAAVHFHQGRIACADCGVLYGFPFPDAAPCTVDREARPPLLGRAIVACTCPRNQADVDRVRAGGKLGHLPGCPRHRPNGPP
jgi:hypothetical protein